MRVASLAIAVATCLCFLAGGPRDNGTTVTVRTDPPRRRRTAR